MNWPYLKELFFNLVKTLSDFFTDNIIIKSLMSAWLFFAGIHIYFYCVMTFIVFDCITGIWASIKRGEKFKSRYLRNELLVKGTLYIILMLSAFAMEAVFKLIFPWDKFFCVFFITILISTYEVVSICENIW